VTFDPAFVNCLEFLRTTAERQSDFITQGRTLQPQIENPDWNGEWTDRAKMAEVFDRTKIEEQIGQIMKNPVEHGTVSDMVMIAVQSDVLGAVQRAIASRHTSYVKADAHAFARRRGHAHPRGIWLHQWTGPLEFVDKAGKNEQR
jgi:hypothetical protein